MPPAGHPADVGTDPLLTGSDGSARERISPVPGRVAVVGICASGKSTLVEKLCALGVDARCCAQEHSYVPDMWQRLSRPEILVYLDASLYTVHERGRPEYDAALLETQRQRLAHARDHCRIYVGTDGMTNNEVFDRVCQVLLNIGILT